MASRMERYYEPENNIGLRAQKNANLYKKLSQSEIQKFEVASNSTVLSRVDDNIDVEKIRKILDTRYKDAPKRRSIRVDTPLEKPIELPDEPKEYDLNVILAKAKENKEESYEKERLKKLRDTQYNILNNLNLAKTESETKTEEEKTLIDLINTITEREVENEQKKLDPLGILTNLSSDVVGNQVSSVESKSEAKEGIDTSFFTNSTQFDDSDFDDFNDLKAEVKSHKNILKILIVILILVFIVGLGICINTFLL